MQVSALSRFFVCTAWEELGIPWKNLRMYSLKEIRILIFYTAADDFSLRVQTCHYTRSVCVYMIDCFSFPSSHPLQILEALARNDEQLVQTCSRINSGTELVPEELQLRFSSMCAERLEHINRRITNYRKVQNPQNLHT